jgi:glycosyltransferase involved in cell wall biosynthesis
VWLDLTALLRATRPQPTGIPRTVARLFHTWLAQGRTGLRYCQLSEASGGFVEVDPQAVLARFPPRPVEKPPSAPQKRPLVFRLFRRAGSLLPGRVRRPLKALARRGARAAVAARDGLRALWASRTPAPPPLALGPGDLVVSGGGGWAVAQGSELVWRLKREQGFRLATLLYDIIPVLFPHYYGPGFPAYFENWTANTIWASDLLLTISEHSRRDLQAYCADRCVPCPPIEVLRLGEDIAPDNALDAPPADLKPGEPFSLSVGTVEVRKNHLALYQVWRRLLQARPDAPKLVLVGGKGWLSGDLLYQIDTDPVTAGRVIVLTEVDDGQLLWLYRHCLFTLYPSFYEGWGLPIAESLGHGKYCIASDTSSMPEVGGDLVGGHDPADVPACLRLVEQALDPAFRAEREGAIRRRYRPATWADCADQLAAALRRHFGAAAALCPEEDRDAGPAADRLPDPAPHPRGAAPRGGDLGRLSA